ncbi:transposase [Streptomyces sp. NPDC056323]|uniref:transposase n=1 Tax=Streptomyces sp. NPDC056323 TaxID=3345784 RepID=UPI0035D6E929
MRDRLDGLWCDEDFADWYPRDGRPGLSPAQLATVCVLQFLLGLSDRQAAEAVRCRIDFKYAMAMELDDPGFHHSVLADFRDRLAEDDRADRLLDLALARLKEAGLVRERTTQRTDSTHVLAAVRDLTRLELISEAVRAALEEVASTSPHLLGEPVEEDWGRRYGRPVRLGKNPTKPKTRILATGNDAVRLLEHLYRLTADHLVGHFDRWPADELAGVMLGAFFACGDAAYRAHGDALMEQQAAVAGPESWPWMGWLASARAEQGRVREAHGLAGRALALYPSSGVAVHALAHAEHELGAGRACTDFLDQWLRTDPQAVQARHLNWHAALQSIACGDFPDARRRADTALARRDVGMRAATNWRLLLAGQSPAGRSDPDHVRELLTAPGGMAEAFHTFNLALALAVESATDDLHILARRAAADARPEFHEVLAPVVQALAEITAGRPRAAVNLLSGLGEKTERIGGVRVEREIIQDTLARALIDTGEHARAAGLLHHRTTTRRHHTYENLLLAARVPASVPGPR